MMKWKPTQCCNNKSNNLHIYSVYSRHVSFTNDSVFWNKSLKWINKKQNQSLNQLPNKDKLPYVSTTGFIGSVNTQNCAFTGPSWVSESFQSNPRFKRTNLSGGISSSLVRRISVRISSSFGHLFIYFFHLYVVVVVVFKHWGTV